MWLARHTPEKVLPILHRVLTAVKEEYADAYENGGGIYAAGYCFGAKYALLLGSELHKDVAQGQRAPDTQAEEGMVKQGPMVKCAAIAQQQPALGGQSASQPARMPQFHLEMALTKQQTRWRLVAGTRPD